MSEIIRNLRRAAFATALTVGVAACSETTHGVRVEGFAHIQNANVYDTGWIQHTGEDETPDDRPFRELAKRKVENGSTCYVYAQDGTCSLSLKDYKTVYDFEAYEPYIHHSCKADINWQEYPNVKLQRDEGCLTAIEPGQWLVMEHDKFYIELAIPLKGSKTQECAYLVKQEDYASYQNKTLTVEHNGCDISNVKIEK